MNQKFRNIAIIAHVDHGKTTLIDKLLQESGIFKIHEEKTERIMDSNDLERERGITITAKNTSIKWNKYKINIVDTPGHADFGGEVERVLSMVDSVLLVVDALDGPMPQTRFVTEKAFRYNLNPIVVVNKIDRKNSRPNWVIDQIFDLFINLNATDKQLDFPIVYTSALLGKSGLELNKLENNMSPLFNIIIKHTPAPQKNIHKKFKMQISQLDYDNYLGIIGIGRIHSGSIKPKQKIKVINQQGKNNNGEIKKILKYSGLKKMDSQIAFSGDIIAVAGIENIKISDTICDIKSKSPLPKLNIDEPTVKMFFSVNSSPFAGTEGIHVTSRKILERLNKEKMHNVALKVEETNDSSTFCVSGRGELHLSILIENMRREGYELEVSRPKVIFKKKNGIEKEPFELIVLDIKEKYQGVIMQYIGERKGEMKNMILDNRGRVRLEYIISSRALIGFRSEFTNITAGTGLFYSSFSHYDNISKFNISNRRNGVLISNNTGYAVAFSLFNLQERGKLFLGHGAKVYEGQIIGIHSKSNDLTVNCLAGKKLTNMRASGTDEAINLIKPINLTLEQAMSFINDDELIEITPKEIRLRKKFLKENQRKSASRKKLIST
ncbi:translational GTPase TypA [Buchnera aphidicola]|uniref:translational GTPase TypA n=1 Tax=Buchnera aphidicola TaxID=9 RepID=UPI0025429798|nr:translational GTPase TypA [Buchnera aphidicola]WII23559.1 translational GTPase TypA [Buchnera aphidicola (Sipha maydis)]